MTICFVCSEYPPHPHGGIGTVTSVLAHALVARGHQVRAIGVYGPEVVPERAVDGGGVAVRRLAEPPRWRGGWISGRVALWRELRRWAAAGEVDVIEVPDWQGWAAGWPQWHVPVVARLHGSMTYFAHEQGRLPSPLVRELEIRTLRRASAWCAVSRYTASRTARYVGTSRPTVVLPNPVEHVPDGDGPRDGSAVVFAGTLTPKKGVVALAEAWNAVVTQHPDACLHCFGKDGRMPDDTSVRDAMLARMSTAARERVRFHGQVPRDVLRRALSAAGIAVCPSFAEAFAMAPLEAMAAGCATVSTKLGSGPEQFTHEQHGLLVDPREPATIAAALCRLLGSPSECQQLADAGRRWVRHAYGVADLARRNEEWYANCVEAHRLRAQRTSPPASSHAGQGTRTA
jgi:glycosyltransferase involved in cell wall biosynthesis